MKYIKLGNSDLTVSRVCMGCMGFGDAGKGMHSWTLPESASREIVKRGLELGVNFLTRLSPTRAGPANSMWDYGTPLYDIMDGLNRVVKAGKVRYIGLSNCYAYRLAKRPGETSARLEQDSYAKLK